MAERLGVAVLELRTDDRKLTRGLKRAKGAARALDRSLDQTGRAAIALGTKFQLAASKMRTAFVAVATRVKAVGLQLRNAAIPLALFGAAAIKVTFEFDEALAKIIGLVGESREQVEEWRKSILELSPAVGKGPVELANALFFITSAGFKGQKALDILEQSAKAAAGGLGETAVVADAVTNALAAYAESGLEAGDATDTLVAAIQAAKVEASDLAPILGRILPFSSELGISFSDTAGAIAILTKQTGDAALAATGLRGILAKLVKPSEQGKIALAGVGLSVEDLTRNIQEQGLVAALRDLEKRFGGNRDLMGKVFEDIEGLLAVYTLLGTDVQVVADVMKIMEDRLGATDRAIEAQEGGVLDAKQAWAAFNVALILIGDVLKGPVLDGLNLITAALVKFAETGPKIVDAFGGMMVAASDALFRVLVPEQARANRILDETAARLERMATRAAQVRASLAKGIVIDPAAPAAGEVIEVIDEEAIARMNRASAAVILMGEGFKGLRAHQIAAREGMREWSKELEDQAAILRRQIMTPQQRYNELIKKYTVLLKAGKISREVFTEAEKQAAEALREMTDEVEDTEAAVDKLGDEVESVMGRMIGDLKAGELSWESFADVAINAIRNIADSFISSLGEQAGGFLGDILGAAVGSFIGGGGSTGPGPGGSGVPRFQGGGSLRSRELAIVGEAGPEFFRPDVPGTVIPNESIGLGGVVFNQSFDFRGADPGVFSRAHIFAKQIKEETIDEMAELMDSGGTMSQISGRRRKRP